MHGAPKSRRTSFRQMPSSQSLALRSATDARVRSCSLKESIQTETESERTSRSARPDRATCVLRSKNLETLGCDQGRPHFEVRNYPEQTEAPALFTRNTYYVAHAAYVCSHYLKWSFVRFPAKESEVPDTMFCSGAGGPGFADILTLPVYRQRP